MSHSVKKNLSAMWETWVRTLGREDPLEKGKPTHSSILAWRIPWTVQSRGSQRVRQAVSTLLSLLTMAGRAESLFSSPGFSEEGFRLFVFLSMFLTLLLTLSIPE